MHRWRIIIFLSSVKEKQENKKSYRLINFYFYSSEGKLQKIATLPKCTGNKKKNKKNKRGFQS